MGKKAIIVGASGLIGSKLLEILTARHDYDEIVSLARRKQKISHRRLIQKVIDFNEIDQHADLINGEVLFCCLGTTRDQTPDLNEYRKIDHDYPLQLAKIAKQNGVQQYHFISAIGANSGSSNFYLKMKGETENELKQVGVPSLHIYQPSLLTGRQHHKRISERIGEVVMKIVNPLLVLGLAKYRSIPAMTVAVGMYKTSLKNRSGVYVYTTDKIKKIK